MQISVPSSSPKLQPSSPSVYPQPIGPSPVSPKSPRLQWLERHHWSHAADLRKLMQASDSDSESSPDCKKHKKSENASEGKRRKHTSEHKKHRRKGKKRLKEPEHTQPQSTGPSPKSIIPLPSLSVKISASPHDPLALTWGKDGERLKPGLNLSPRKRLSPMGPSAGLIGPAMPPMFRLDAGHDRV